MKRQFLILAGAALLSSAPMLAQKGGDQPKISDAQRQAIMKVQTDYQAQNWEAAIQDVTQLLENFADTPYKSRMELLAMQAATNARNYDQIVIWGDRIAQSDPNEIISRVQVADSIAEHTRENDLDKEQSLKKADDYAHQAITLLQNANTVPANAPVDPANWPQLKQELTGQAYYALALSADLRKNYPDAQKSLQSAAQADTKNALYPARLSKVDIEAKQYDAAISDAQKAIDMPGAVPQIKAFAEQQKQQATTLKGTAK